RRADDRGHDGAGLTSAADPGGVGGRRGQPLTHRRVVRRATTSTRSDWAATTASRSLYAPGISSTTPSSLRHSTPAVCAARSAAVNRLRAAVRDMRRPAPWDADQYEAGLPRPRTTYEPVPIDPGMRPSSPVPARIAPLRVTTSSVPSTVSVA